MAREKKTQAIEQLQKEFTGHEVGVFTSFRGLPTPEMNTVRAKLREAGAEYKVVKNTLARLAVERAGKSDLAPAFDGPIGVAFGSQAPSQLAKAIVDYIRSTRSALAIRGGYLGDRLLTPEDVGLLATLPAREVLIARVLGGMQGPVASLLGCLQAPVRGVMIALQARIKQLEGG